MSVVHILIKILLALTFSKMVMGTSTTKRQVLINGTEEKQEADTSQGSQSNAADSGFFFTNVGPHGFEYRAVLDHGDNPFNLRKQFGPFFNGLPEFPQFPNINNVPGIREIFAKFTPSTTQQPVYPLLPEIVHHPTISPILQPRSPRLPVFEQFRRRDVIDPKTIHHHKTRAEDYPKIFKFNDERINIIDFDRKKKYGKDNVRLNKGDYLDPDRIFRNKFLILHGGVFKVEDKYQQHELSYKDASNKENPQKHHIQYYNVS